MQAELCSHIGLKGNHFCRCCHVGGDKVFKESDAGFPSLLAVRDRLSMTEVFCADIDYEGRDSPHSGRNP